MPHARPSSRRFVVATMELLRPLVGMWSMVGRTLDADADDIAGTTTIRWAVEDEVMTMVGDRTIKDDRVRSLEVVWRDHETGQLRSHLYTGEDDPLDYRWDVTDGEYVHAGPGATYRGAMTDDESVIAGGWRPETGSAATGASAHDVTMRRIG